MRYETQGALVRTKSNWHEYAEKNTKYFFQLEKSRAKNKAMSYLISDEGQKLTTQKQILAEQKSFYQKLYTADPKISFRMNVEVKNKIDSETQRGLDQALTIEEITKAMREAKLNRTPGPDGIPIDFYVVFFNKLKDKMLQMFNYCFEVKRMNISSRNGTITLLPKQGRDTRFLKHWRPIILLCSDYKVLSKVISNRLKTTLNTLIHQDQTGFIAGRQIATNIRRALDTVQFANNKNLNAVLISLDFQKAFDRVDKGALEKTLQYFGFGKIITEWVKLLFKDMKLCTCNNGFTSEYFSPSRGLFQGNPISSTAFVMIIELLAIKIRANRNIEGIQVREIKNLISLFADDLDLFVMNNVRTGNALVNEIHEFEKASGLKVNYDKSTVYRLGSARKANVKQYVLAKVAWTNEPANILGIKVSDKSNTISEINLQGLLDKVDNIFKIWSQRGLSLIGKILIVNT